MILLEGSKVTKQFGGLRALDQVDFKVNEGELRGIIGPNGSGKTTLFNLISGVYSLTSGSICFQSKSLSGMKPYTICRNGIARTYQLVRPFLNMKVSDNIMVGICFGCGKKIDKEARENVTEILNLVNLASKSNRLAKELTMAERKRLEIGRAVASSPRVILLDEVMAGLNPKEVEEMIDLVRKIFERGIAVMIIEHVMKAVAALCSRIMVLNYGKKIFEGTPDEVANNEEVIKAYLGKKRSKG
jgi:branched-chain amino acid transport system ATP-binding protein